MLTPKELPTVLAALRHWQDLETRSPAVKFPPGDTRKGTFFEEHDPLTVEEIDALCERLNCSPNLLPPPVIPMPDLPAPKPEDIARATRLIALAPELFDLCLSVATWQGVPKILKDEAAELVAKVRADGKAVPS